MASVDSGKRAHLQDGQEMDREEVDGEHDDDGDQHLGHFASGPELIVQGPVGRVQPGKEISY